MGHFRTSTAMLGALLGSTAFASPALAQAQGSGTIFKQVDGNGVDVSSGAYDLSIPLGSLGQGRLSLVELLSGSTGFNLQLYFHRSESGSDVTFTLTLGESSETFTGSRTATSFNSAQGTGAVLAKVNASEYLHTAADGTRTRFTWPNGFPDYKGGQAAYCADGNEFSCSLLAQTVITPGNSKLSYEWRTGENCRSRTLPNGEVVEDCAQFYRLTSVTADGGYKIALTYQNNTDPTSYQLPPPSWHKRTGATFWNGTTQVGTATLAYPSSTVTDLTDIGGRTWKVTRNASQYVTGVRRPGSATDDIIVAMTSNKVSQVTRDGVTTNYGWSDSGSTRILTITNALGQQSEIRTDLNIGRPTSSKDALNRITGFQYDDKSRLTVTTQPEGNSVQLTYDARGNVTQTKAVAKPGSGLADIVTSASFDASCTNIVKCNKPNSSTDARGNITDYGYDPTTGELLSVTLPAPTAGAVRPQTRYSYTQQGTGPRMLTATSACQTTASCNGTADEALTTIAYNANLHPGSITRGNGNGSLAATQAMTYDNRGNLLTVDGPLAGTDDTTRYRYDGADQLIGVVGPDPDGAGTLKHRATRYSYDPAGILWLTQFGTVNDQSDAAWASFSEANRHFRLVDGNGRIIRETIWSAGVDYAVVDHLYDALGRRDCSVTYMNPAAWGPQASICQPLQTSGPFGPDRVAKLVYDAAGQVTQRQVAVGTSDAATEQTLTYTTNGQLQTLKDAENNLTTYEYDGHDRLSKTRFPVTTKGASSSSTTDYEQLTYDAASNVTSRRLRDAQSIGFTYDNLNRVTLKNLPGVEPDVSYAYDNLGRLTSAGQTGSTLSFSYDALGRNLTQAGPQGTVASEWDLAGRRTRLTWPGGGLYVDYDYLVTGEVVKIRENGATSGIGVLATFAYDDLGRRTNLTFGNGASTAYAFDPASRLTSLTNDLAGTANDLTIGSISYNPAGQIVSQQRSNDAYSWTAHYNENRNYSANGLNQYSASGAIVPTYDARGNLTSAGTTSYAYSSENMLVSASGGTSASLSYDPALRLAQVTGGSTTRFGYDGVDLIAEYDGTDALLRRYVHGPGMDEPLVWYEGSGTGDRRFLSSDERGSIVSVTDASGALLAINSYDEYGIPGSSNAGRFQYTGQAWLPELGMHHYKARIYSPTLGRFLQTDPIGYGDGMNIYAYVGNDPVNLVDPSGLFERGDTLLFRKRYDASGGSWGGSKAGSGKESGSSNGSVTTCSPGASCDISIVGNREAFTDWNDFFDLPQFEPFDFIGAALERAAINEIVVTGRRQQKIGVVKIDWGLPDGQEQHWLVYSSTDIVYIGILGKMSGDVGVSKYRAPRSGYVAIVHTHPWWSSLQPGPGDWGKRVPVYGIGYDGVWVIDPGSLVATHLWGKRP